MTDRINPDIMDTLTKKTGKTIKQIRPRLSELRRKYSALTMNAAAQMYAQLHNTSVMGKLSLEDRHSLATVQTITQVSVSSVSKTDKRTFNVSNSLIHNLSFGDRNTINQNVAVLDNALDELSDKIDKNITLTDGEKNDYKSDIQTIASQAGKDKPNRRIIKLAWESVKTLADIEGFAQLIIKITPLIQGFFS